jgi:hypothetical protein
MAAECRARGGTMLYAPIIDVAEDPRWSRCEESFGEDPLLVARLAAAQVEGIQGAPAAVWQAGKPGALAFDALNRSLLVRFPDAAEKIAARLAAGEVVAKVELVLPFRDEELWPPGAPDAVVPDGYNARRNWGCIEMYRQIRPQWHAVAWALRRPWTADATSGPTYNAAVAGAVTGRSTGRRTSRPTASRSASAQPRCRTRRRRGAWTSAPWSPIRPSARRWQRGCATSPTAACWCRRRSSGTTATTRAPTSGAPAPVRAPSW